MKRHQEADGIDCKCAICSQNDSAITILVITATCALFFLLGVVLELATNAPKTASKQSKCLQWETKQ